MLFCLLALPVFAKTDTEIAYRYTDGNTQDKTPDEYFDAYGNKITEVEYRAQYEDQVKEMQENASKPFGSAGEEFGGLRKKKDETVDSKKESAAKKALAPTEETEEIEKESKKARVLVS